jgi:hypothetical protein
VGARGAVHQERERRHQEEEAHDVVRRLAGLRADHHVRVQDDRGAEHRDAPDPVRPPDAPGGKQAERAPHQVDQRREEVGVERDDPDAVQELRVLRVEPGRQLQRIGEVERPDVPGLVEPGREGHVVPGGVLVVHPLVECLAGRVGPVDDDEDGGRDPDRDHDRARADLRRPRHFGQASPANEVGSPEAGRDAAEHQGEFIEQPEGPDQLGDQDQHREPDHHLGEACQRAHPGWDEQGS